MPTEYNGEGTRYRQWVNTKAGSTSTTGGSQPHGHPFEGGTEQADSLPPFLSFEMVVRVA